MQVPSVAFFLFFAIVAAYDHVVTKHEIVFPTDEIQALKSFTNFLKLVEDNQMNVSLVVSQSKTYSNRHPRESSTNSTLDSSQHKDFLKTATEDKLATEAMLMEEETNKVWINKLNGLPVRPDWKNKTVKLIYGDLNIETINSKNLCPPCSHPDIFWQVVADVGANSYINAKTSITLKLLGTNYLIFHT
ncbi:hypothetical protein MTP99_017894 [Tenebrio molitor]|nr:hypothetical protein MTP99_017894 [Tenebrio molitor]